MRDHAPGPQPCELLSVRVDQEDRSGAYRREPSARVVEPFESEPLSVRRPRGLATERDRVGVLQVRVGDHGAAVSPVNRKNAMWCPFRGLHRVVVVDASGHGSACRTPWAHSLEARAIGADRPDAARCSVGRAAGEDDTLTVDRPVGCSSTYPRFARVRDRSARPSPATTTRAAVRGPPPQRYRLNRCSSLLAIASTCARLPHQGATHRESSGDQRQSRDLDAEHSAS